MKTLIITAALFITGVVSAQKGFESYPQLLIPMDGVAYQSMIDSSYAFGTDELTVENTQIILDEMTRILALYGQDLNSTVRTIPEGANFHDAFNPKQVICLHYKIGNLMLYFGTWNDEDGTHVGFNTRKVEND